jgi:hypothetical protein
MLARVESDVDIVADRPEERASGRCATALTGEARDAPLASRGDHHLWATAQPPVHAAG